MKFCSECGFKIEDNKDKCPNCGNKLKRSLFDNFGKNTRKFMDNLDDEKYRADLFNKVVEYPLSDIPKLIVNSSKTILDNISPEDIHDFKESFPKIKKDRHDSSNLIKARKAFNKEGFFNSVFSDEKRYLNIIDLCDKVISKDESNYEAYFLKGASLFYLKKYDESIMSLSKSLTLNFNNFDAKLFLAESYRLTGSYNDSLSMYELLSHEFPENPRILKGKALLFYDIGKFTQSNTLFENAYNFNKDIFDDNDYYTWGLCLQKLDLHFKAQNKFEKAKLINPCSKYQNIVYTNRNYISNNSINQNELYDVALRFFNEFDYGESLNILNKALKIKSNNSKVISLLCKCELFLADYNNCLKYCNKLLNLDESLDNYNLKVECLIGLKDYEEALTCYKKSLSYDDHALMTANVGFIYYFKGDEKTADKYFNKSLNISYNSRASLGKALIDSYRSDVYIDSALKYCDNQVDEILINCIKSAFKWDNCVDRVVYGPSYGQRRIIDEVHVYDSQFKKCMEYVDTAYETFVKWNVNKYYWLSNFGFKLLETRFFDLSRNNYYIKGVGADIDWKFYNNNFLRYSWSHLGDVLIKIYGNNIYYVIEQGKIFNTFGDGKNALPKFDSALMSCSDDLLRFDIYSYKAQAHKNSGNDELMRQNFNKAIEGYDSLLKNTPNNTDLLIRKALNYAQMGEKGQALALFNRVLEIDSNNYNAKRGINNINNF